MSAQRVPSGDLCGVRDHGHRRLKCGGLATATLDIETERGYVELAVCELHLAEVKASEDPIETARQWAS